MKIRNFKEHLEKRLNKAEIVEIEIAAQLEFETLQNLQNEISKALINYMAEEKIGFNDLVRKLGKSPTQISKIIKGEANITLATIAQLFAIMHRKPHIVF